MWLGVSVAVLSSRCLYLHAARPLSAPCVSAGCFGPFPRLVVFPVLVLVRALLFRIFCYFRPGCCLLWLLGSVLSAPCCACPLSYVLAMSVATPLCRTLPCAANLIVIIDCVSTVRTKQKRRSGCVISVKFVESLLQRWGSVIWVRFRGSLLRKWGFVISVGFAAFLLQRRGSITSVSLVGSVVQRWGSVSFVRFGGSLLRTWSSVIPA